LRDNEFSETLLAWYDVHARAMPWRVAPDAVRSGVRPDPYHVWLSEVMLQQTTVAAVRNYFPRFVDLWPTVSDLAAAADGDVMGEWAGLGYYARARNLLKCARLVAERYGGRFPDTREELMELPGIGPYTASAIAAIAFDRREAVVDGNVERVMARIFLVRTALPKARPELTRLAERLTPARRPGDYAQAVMDLGATVCTPRSPACGACPWMSACAARRAGLHAELPRRIPKATRPVRRGIAYLARRMDRAWLLERRPESGLLGGTLGWPCSDWTEMPTPAPPVEADWRDPGVEVRHAFTHFHLHLSLRIAELPEDICPAVGGFVQPEDFRRSDLPTVMRKAYDIAAGIMDSPK